MRDPSEPTPPCSSWRIFLLGSCVSRDALETAPGTFEIACYLARTSMASIGMGVVNDAAAREKLASMPSEFQRRMLLNDLDKTTLSTVTDTPHDLLLLDFVDERFKLVLSGSTFYSFSGELQKAGLPIEGRATLDPDSDAFLALWTVGLERLLRSVDPGKVVLNRSFWAEHFPDGSDASSMGWIKRNNALLQRFYDTVDSHWKVSSIDYPPEVLVADPLHRWGVAPYHYVDAYYRHAVNALNELAVLV